ncbi:hypothetical protein [Vibrio sp. M260121]|uniref:hypothetical protein n=1 Tax=Vibrio sp. M260121 TaxID=3020897 RepID=UPI002F3F9ADC
MNNYFEINSLRNIYLEDSFVLGITEKNNEIEYEVEFVLNESHPLYIPPKETEQYCYQKGLLLFKGVSSVTWEERTNKFSFDKNDEIDYGNIDCFSVSGSHFSLSGDWGALKFKADSVVVVFN